jgi:O-acetyl-ADP-ribose deacetylase (regulator of RNase III)
VIHAVGPVWRGGNAGEDALLASAVRAALARADQMGAKSVALPAISTGVFGYPVDRAAQISIAAARTFAGEARVVEKIAFCLFDERTFEVFRRELEKDSESQGSRSRPVTPPGSLDPAPGETRRKP